MAKGYIGQILWLLTCELGCLSYRSAHSELIYRCSPAVANCHWSEWTFGSVRRLVEPPGMPQDLSRTAYFNQSLGL